MKATVVETLKYDGFGEYKLIPESLDDLWHLWHLISRGSVVFSMTLRTVNGPRDKLRAEKLEKRQVYIGIKCEKIEFLSVVARLRVFGIIVFGQDMGQHHTLNIEIGYEIGILQQWRSVDLKRLERAIASSFYGAVHIVAIEEGEVELYRIHQYGPKLVVNLTIGSGKTREIDSRQNLFEELLRELEAITGPIVVAGPGFVKEDFVKFVKTTAPRITEQILLVDTRRSGYGAVQEAIGNGVLKKAIGDLQLEREVQVMEEIFLRIKKNGAVSYGMKDVEDAINYGMAEIVVVADTEVIGDRVSRMIENAEKIGANVVVLSTEFEPGKRLLGLGGVAALLRYKILK